jgi:hypothetical protein
MYAETFGIQYPSPAVEAAARWVQWAQAGLMAGAAENDPTIRYNLNQFWTAKAAAYPTSSQTDQTNLDRLDVWAHGIWSALETGKIYSAAPGYWDFWKSWFTGGTPVNPDSMAAASAAAAANAGQAAAATRVTTNAPTLASFGTTMAALAAQNTANIPQNQASAANLWKQPGVPGVIPSIPTWAWIAAAAGVVILLTAGRR